MANTGITIDFNANLARFTSAIDKATSDLNRFQSNAQRISRNIGNAFSALGVGFSVTGLVSIAKQSIDAADNMLTLARRTGTTVKELASLELAAKQADVPMEELAKGLNRLSIWMTKNAEEAKRLGITAKNPVEAFIQFAGVLSRLESPQAKAALANEAFSKSFATLMPLLLQGNTALREAAMAAAGYAEQMDKLAPKADAFNDRLAVLTQKLQAFSITAATAFMDLLPNEWTMDPAEAKLKKLQQDLANMERHLKDKDGQGLLHRWLFGSKEELEKRIAQTRAEIEATKKALDAAKSVKQKSGVTDEVVQCMLSGGIWDGKQCRKRSERTTTAAPKVAVDPLKGLLSRTETAQLKEYYETLALLDARHAKGGISAKQYQEALMLLNEELDRQLGFGMSLADTTEEIAKQYYDVGGGIRYTVEEIQHMNAALNESAAINQQWAEEARQLVMSSPYNKLAADVSRLQEMLDRGLISWDIYADATFEAYKGVSKVTSATEELKDKSIELQMAFSSAFEDAIVKGKKLSAVISGLVQDLSRIAVRKYVTEPLSTAFTQMLSGISFKGLIPGFATGTDYVPRDMLAYVHKGEAIIPASENRGGAGRSITVNMTVVTPDASSFRRSSSQIAAEMTFALQRAQRVI